MFKGHERHKLRETRSYIYVGVATFRIIVR